MRKFIFLSIAVVVAMSLQAQKKAHRFAVKSGYVKYKLTGNITGTKELWWDDYGQKTRELEQSKTVTKILGMSRTDETHKLEIINKDNFFAVNYKENKATKGKVPDYSAKSVIENMTEAEQKKLSDDVLAGLGGRRLGTEKVLGYTCDVISVMGAKSWVYKGVTLKTYVKILGMENNSAAVEFKPNISVDASKFKEPAGVDFEIIEIPQQGEGGMLGALTQAMEEENNDEEEEREVKPVKYPYDKFLKKVNTFKHDGYNKFMAQKSENGYAAMFMKGFGNMILIGAASKEGADKSEIEKSEWFTHNGKRYMYYTDSHEGQKASLLVQDIKEYDTFIIITSKPAKEKEELLKIADKFGF